MCLDKLKKIENCINAFNQIGICQLIIGKTHKFEEIKKNDSSKMLLECTVSAGYEMLSIHKLEGNNKFGHLQCRNCADGVLLDINHSNNTYRMIVVELKTTINEKELQKIPKQFLGAVLRTLTLLTPTDLRDNTIEFCVLFSNEDVYNSKERSKESSEARIASKNEETLRLWESNKMRANGFSDIQKESIRVKDGCIPIIKKTVKNKGFLSYHDVKNLS